MIMQVNSYGLLNEVGRPEWDGGLVSEAENCAEMVAQLVDVGDIEMAAELASDPDVYRALVKAGLAKEVGTAILEAVA